MKKYINPDIDILLFDEEEDILTTSSGTTSVNGYTAAMDVNAQMDAVLNGSSAGSSSISTVRLEDINIK